MPRVLLRCHFAIIGFLPRQSITKFAGDVFVRTDVGIDRIGAAPERTTRRFCRRPSKGKGQRLEKSRDAVYGTASVPPSVIGGKADHGSTAARIDHGEHSTEHPLAIPFSPQAL